MSLQQRASGWQISTATRSVGFSRVAPSTITLELAAVVALVLAALAVRLPELGTVPRFTDETNDIMLGWRIRTGEALPFTAKSIYIGSFF